MYAAYRRLYEQIREDRDGYALALATGWKLGLVVSSCLPIIFASGLVRMRLEMAFDERCAGAFADCAQFASQAVAAMRTVVAFTIERTIWEEYDARLAVLLGESYQNVAMSMFWYTLAESVQYLVMALAFWYGGQLLATGKYITEQFYIIYLAVLFGGESAATFFSYTPSISKAVKGGQYILKLRNTQVAIADDFHGKDPDTTVGFTFNDVGFEYPLRKGIRVLQDLGIEIQPGTSVAIVGGSGSGKSTIISLLDCYYDPTYGSIRLGASTLPELCLSGYRARLALVSQQPCLFQGSIKENIMLGAVDGKASMHEIEQAARDANILDFITSLPQGMDTECGAKGTELSGGQRQRLCLARALVRNPAVLLLDEAASALDSTSEKAVLEALQGVTGGRTAVSVAHRMSTIRSCDVIFVLEEGRVVEACSHAKLLALNGSYKKLCDAQSFE
ncbi:P-loop containing nucleoside triphosphate hydrolase protein [Teratosphaeria nubilosa]|uniref:P-loop containing nucleoside triphosphate hydrolase protein n=1 Tax=Teratosphaeria nubilosa TaxID=161662 RepID=A0A6G1KWL3_9PEZI|nr:P-loop containing nucleoside triphosphate hydrolase protein [Teratosphaeria nubilosa]